MNIGVFHPGTQHSWQTALALQQLDRLAWYATSIFYKPDQWPYRIERYLPGTWRARASREFQRFSMPSLNTDHVITTGWMEWAERIFARLNLPRLANRLDKMGNRQFVHRIADQIKAPGQLALWGYSDSARSSFELARQHGRTCILDRTIGDFRAYNAAMADIQADYGEWFLPTERMVSDEQIADNDREYELADHILVGSEYVAETIRRHSPVNGAAKKLRILDYCYDENLFSGLHVPRQLLRDRPVRFLFLGLVGPRKGIHHVLEAIAQIPASQAELTIVGHMKVPPSVFGRYADRVNYHATVPRSEVPTIMANHDVLLLPSYHEGAAIALYEGLAAGMGLIQSRNTGLVATKDTGLILDTISTESVLEAMLVPIRDRALLDSWRARAQGEAAQYSFARYRENIARFLAEAGI